MFKKEKILMSLIILMLVVCVFGSINSLATEITAGNNTNTIVITPGTSGNNTTNNTTSNVISITGTVKNTTGNNTVSNKVNKTANSSTYESGTNSTKLPYAGTNSSIIFIVLAFIGSAIYAYKKVTEYNV